MALIKLRRGTATEWTSSNPILAAGEPGFESDTRKLKIGNGSTTWNNLPYVAGDIASATLAGEVELATTAEVLAGTDTVRAVTPAGVQAALDSHVPALPAGTFNLLAYPYSSVNAPRPAVPTGSILYWINVGIATTTRPTNAATSDIVTLSPTMGTNSNVTTPLNPVPADTLVPSDTLVPNGG